MPKEKPDCTGERFGQLIVLGKGSRHPKSNIQLWKVKCDCGVIFEIPRGYFELNGQVSCGCKKRSGYATRLPFDITGQRFGKLTAIALIGKKDKNGKPVWALQCDCGNTCELSLTVLRGKERDNLRINCGDRSQHKDIGFHYPESPIPYPQDATDIVSKYLHLTNLNHQFVDSAVEDNRLENLLRAAWIIAYRRRQGENISESHEFRYVKKWLHYCSVNVFWRRKLEEHGGFLYTETGKKKQIGDVMTDSISLDYPVIETLGINYISAKPTEKKLRFRRC
jgi:hypothetical protein